jgi:hypothetical protein
MSKLHIKISTCILILFAFFACERVVETLDPISYDYFPLSTNKFKTYKIDSTVYDEYNCSVVLTSYYIKEITGAEGTDAEGDPYYPVYRYITYDTSQPWVLLNIWTEKIEDNQVQRVEDNQRLIKLVFPVLNDKRWDGIPYIRRDTLVPLRGGVIDMYKDWDDFVIHNVGETFVDTVSGTLYTDAVQISQVDKTNNIERRFSREVYAKDIGMVYREMWILDTQCRTNCTGVGDIATCIFTQWEDKAEKGFIITQSLIDYN